VVRARLTIALALGLCAGCDARSGLAGDGAVGSADGAAGSRAETSTSDATDTGGEIAGSPCTPGADQTCNEDPTISALAGECRLFSDPPVAACVCRNGFSYNPMTQRCRSGSTCVASGADAWAVTVPLDVAGCATRPSSCSAAGATAADRASYEVGNLVMPACRFPSLLFLRVEIENGCPTLFELNHQPLDAGLVGCLEKELSSARWDCLGPSACGLYEWDTLP